MSVNREEKIKWLEDLYKTKIEVSDEIPDCMPKQAEPMHNFFSSPRTEEEMESFMLRGQKEFVLREAYNQAGMYAFVSKKWVVPFSRWIGERKVMEVIAGRGFLAKALREQGIEVHASDNFSWGVGNWTETVTEVEKMDAIEAVLKHGKDHDILIMGWPYMDDLAYYIIKTLYQVNPNALVVYIGEGNGGCTASERFFEHFKLIEDEGFEEATSNYQSWEYIHDRLYLGRYSEKNID